MNGYKAFYKGRTLEVYADTILQARNEAAEKFGVTKRPWEVAIVLCEKDGQTVIHSTAEID